ncbi:MAG: HesA/MoeB/ThiF family protein [Flavobacteriaceae bacterium]|nr:HesA/MoeB/ThiF family protein [Flavobacteriaceae bacterium]
MRTERYIRQTSLAEFGSDAQSKLQKAKVLVVGAGGLGIPVLQYLNAMGVGTLGIVEHDTVDITNLHRQVLYDESDIGKSKIKAIAKKLATQNSETDLQLFDTFLTPENALEIISDFDLVMDCSDNFPTRYLVNDACVILNKPFVYAALHGFEGQVSVFNYKGGPTYRCLFPDMPDPAQIPDCNTNGVLGIIPGIVGNFQALEAVKVVAGIGDVVSGSLLIYDGLQQLTYKIKFPLTVENLKIKSLKKSYAFDTCPGQQNIATEEFINLLETNKTMQLIDVRSPDEFAQFHLEKSKNIPLDGFESGFGEINFSKPVYLLCQSGVRSMKALNILKNHHPSVEVYNLEGGLNQYRKYALGY